jgi:sulfite exporter TauE/SafE
VVGTVRYLTEGFLLGIATGHICLAMCGPVYLPFIMQKDRNLRQSAFIILEISAGRFISYALFGLAAGLVGAQISAINRTYFTASAYVLFSIFLLISALRTSRCEGGCATTKWNKFAEWPIVLGLLTGINFCPSFLIALTKAVDLSGPVAGAFLFIAFFVGTSLFLIPLAFFGILGKQLLLRKLARIAAILVAIWFIGQAAHSVWELYQERKQDAGCQIVSFMDENPLYIVGPSDSARNILTQTFTQYKKGPIIRVETALNLPDTCNVLLNSEWIGPDGKLLDTFNSVGKFVVILPFPSDTLYRQRIEQSATFLQRFSFKFDPKQENVYILPMVRKNSVGSRTDKPQPGLTGLKAGYR